MSHQTKQTYQNQTYFNPNAILTNIIIDGILSSSSIVAETIIMQTSWNEHPLDVKDEKHVRVIRLIRRFKPDDMKRYETESEVTTEQLIAQLSKETSKMNISDKFHPEEFVNNRVVSAEKLLVYLRKVERSKRHAALIQIRKLLNDNWSRSWEFNTNKDLRDLDAQYKKLNITCNIMNVSQSERREKYRKPSHRNSQTYVRYMDDVLPQMKSIAKALAKTSVGESVEANVNETSTKVREVAEDINKSMKGVTSKLSHTASEISSEFKSVSNQAKAMLGNINSTAMDMRARIAQTNTHFNTKMNDLTETITGALDDVKEKMVAAGQSIEHALNIYNVLMFLAKLLSAGYLIYHLSQNECVTAPSVLAIIIMLIPTNCVGSAGGKIAQYLKRAIQGSIAYFNGPHTTLGERTTADTDMEDPDFFPPPPENIIPEDITPQVETERDNLRTGAISNMFFAMWYTVKNLFTGVREEEFVDKARFSTRLRMVSENIKAIKTIGEFFFSVISSIMSWIGDLLMTHFGYIPFFMEADQFKPLVETYYDMRKNHYEKIALDSPDRAAEIIKLHEDLLEYEKHATVHCSKVSAFVRVMPYLKSMIAWCEGVIKLIPDHVLGDETRKVAPFWLYIHGPPRIGKSSFFQPYIINELVRELQLKATYCAPHNYSYFRNPEDTYWDTYQGQDVVQYNDLFQNCYEEEKVNALMTELTTVVDDTPLSLIVAFEGKGKNYFRSRLVVTNAQDDLVGQQFIKCWSGGIHLLARRSVVVRLDIHMQYITNEGIIDQDRVEANMASGCPSICDPMGIPLVPKDMYVLTFSNPMTGDVIRTVDFESGCKYIIDSARNRLRGLNRFRDRLFTYMKNTWNKPPTATTTNNTAATTTTVPVVPPPVLGNYSVTYKAPPQQAPRRQPPRFQGNFRNYGPRPQMDSETHNDEVPFVESRACTCEDNIKRIVAIYAGHYQPYELRTYLNAEHSKGCLQTDEWLSTLGKFMDSHKITTAPAQTTESVKDFERAITDEMIKQSETMHQHAKSKMNNTPWYKSWWFINLGFCMIQVAIRIALIVGAGFAGKKILSKIQQWRHRNDVDEAEPQSNEFKHVGIRKTRRVIKSKPQIYNDSNVDVENVVRQSMARMHIYIDGKKLQMGANVVCLGGDVFASPRHYWFTFNSVRDCCMQENKNFELRLQWVTGAETVVPWENIYRWDPSYEHTGDITYFRIKKLAAHRNISSLFRSCDKSITTYGSYLFGLRSYRSDTDGKPTTALLDIGQPTTQSIVYPAGVGLIPGFAKPYEKKFLECDTMFVYDKSMTQDGDCGMLLMHTDNTVPGKIYGMHVAGSSSASYGYSVPMYYEDIIEAFDKFQEGAEIIPMMELPHRFINETRAPRSKILQDAIEAGIHVIGSLQKEDGTRLSVTLPRKNKVSKSVVYDMMEEDFGPTKFAPTALTPFYNSEGVLIKPLAKALAKLSNYTHLIPESIESEINDHIVSTIESYRSPAERRLLTDYEMVNGNEWTNALDMTTSPGFPYITMKSGPKSNWFTRSSLDGKYVYTAGEYLLSEYRDRIDKAKKGIIKETYFIITLKDETRPIEKVEIGKTRLFQNGPVDYTMAFRKYFGAWIEHCHYEGTNREFSQGMNPNSLDWTVCATYLQEVSRLHRCGDYRNFDSTCSFQSSISYGQAANKWYNDSEENQKIRLVLAATGCFTMQIVDDIVCIFMQGNPSGWRGTTHFNDYNNMRYHRYAYKQLTPFPMHEYFNHNRAKFGGDDNVCTWSAEARAFVTPEKWTNLLAAIGVQYTDAHKNDCIVSDEPFSQISFMKRTWVLDKVRNMYLAPLDFEVIDNIPRWSEGDPTIMEDQIQRFNSCLLELSNYPRETFDKYRVKFVQYCGELRRSGYNIAADRLFGWVDCDKIKYPHCYELAGGKQLSYISLLTSTDVRTSEDSACYNNECSLREQGKNQEGSVGSLVQTPTPYSWTGNSFKKEIQPQSGEMKHVATRKPRRVVKSQQETDDAATFLHEVYARYEEEYGTKLEPPKLEDVKPQIDYMPCDLLREACNNFEPLCVTFGNDTLSPKNEVTYFAYDTTEMNNWTNATSATSGLKQSFIVLIFCFIASMAPYIISLGTNLVHWVMSKFNKREEQNLEKFRQAFISQQFDRLLEILDEYDPEDSMKFNFHELRYRVRFLQRHVVPKNVSDASMNTVTPQMENEGFSVGELAIEHEKQKWLILTAELTRAFTATNLATLITTCRHNLCLRLARITGSMELMEKMDELHRQLFHGNSLAIHLGQLTEVESCEQFSLGKASSLLFWLRESFTQLLILGDTYRKYQPGTVTILRIRELEILILDLALELERCTLNMERESPYARSFTERINSVRRKFDDISPQMENEAAVTTTTEQITSFIDKNEQHAVDVHTGSRRDKALFPRVDLESILRRPYPIGEYNWAPTMTSGSVLFTVSLPEDIMPLIWQYMVKSMYWSPEFELEFRLNAAPQQYGTILLCPWPQGAMLDPQNFTLSAAATGEWSKLHAGASQVLTMKLPYMNPREHLRLQKRNYINDATYAPLRSMNCWIVTGHILTPLSSIASLSQPVTVSVYCRVLNPHLVGHVVAAPQMEMIDDDDEGMASRVLPSDDSIAARRNRASARMRYPRHVSAVLNTQKEDVDKSKAGQSTGIMSKALSLAGTIGMAMAPIPAVGWVLGGIGGLLKGASFVASAFGFSNNRDLRCPAPMYKRSPLVWKSNGLSPSLNIGICEGNMGHDYASVCGDMDDVSLLHIAQRPCIVKVTKIMATDTPGSTLLLMPLPQLTVDLAAGVTPTYLTHFGEISDMFQYIRGSLCFNIAFVCTPFHSCRVRVSFIPVGTKFPTKDTELFDLVGIVIDITKDTEINFSVPYFYDAIVMPQNETYGTLLVTLLNRMVDGGDGKSPIYMEIATFAGADTQFFGIRIPKYHYNNVPAANRVPVPPAPTKVPTDELMKPLVAPQMEIVTGKCELPSSSFSCLMRQEFPPLGGVEAAVTIGNYVNAEELVSVKQITNMQTSFSSTEGLSSIQGYRAQFYHSLGGYGNPVETRQGQNLCAAIARKFRYWKGGIHITIHSEKELKYVKYTGFWWPKQPKTFVPGTALPSDIRLSFRHVENLSGGKIVDFILPYAHVWKTKSVFDHYGIDGEIAFEGTQYTSNSLAVHLQWGSAVEDNEMVEINMGGADDFVLGYLMPVLPLFTEWDKPYKS